MATHSDLLSKVLKAISIVKKRVKKSRLKNPQKQNSIQDYPAVVVACGYSRSYSVFWDESKSPRNKRFNFNIHRRLIKIAPVGTKEPHSGNIIGACAEPHAADKVLKKFPGCHMHELEFSDAYRPRTSQRVKYCYTCKQVFCEVL